MNASLKHLFEVMAATLLMLVGLVGFGQFYTNTATAQEMPTPMRGADLVFYDIPDVVETGKVFYRGDCDKTELFRTRPAPGAILPGEHGYDHDNHEVVATRPDGTIVFKNAVVIHPDGSFEIPEGYSDPVEHEGWREIYTSEYAMTYWDDESGHWDIEYGPVIMEHWIEYQPHPEPYVGSDGEVHYPGSSDYHPELEALWGFVPDALKPEGWQVGIPWPEPLDWSVLDQETAEQSEEGTEWNSNIVFDRWVDGTKVFGNGLILHPNGTYHLPADWQDVTEDGTSRSVQVVFDSKSGEWTVYYLEMSAPIDVPCDWDHKDDGQPSTEPGLADPIETTTEPELADPPIANETDDEPRPESTFVLMSAKDIDEAATDDTVNDETATDDTTTDEVATDEVTSGDAASPQAIEEPAGDEAASTQVLDETVETTTVDTSATVGE